VANLMRIARAKGLCCGALISYLRYKGVVVSTLKALNHEQCTESIRILRNK